MKKLVFILVVVAVIACIPANADALGTRFADVSPTNLDPSQRDINIAVLVVMLGTVLVGYEKVVYGRRTRPKAKQKRPETRSF